MNINNLIDRISNNWAAKVICLILAFFLYIYNRTTSLQKKTFTVPLTVEAEGLMMPAANLPKFVKVLVTTTKENMAFIQESDFSAKVDLSNFTEPGEYTVPVSVSVSEKLELLDTFECRVKTETVNALLDEKILKYIPIEVAPSGTPAYGYKISKFDVSPATVKVVGPSRIVEKTKRIYTKKVIVDGAATSFSLDTKLDTAFNSKIKILPESDFKVTVKIEPVEETRKYEKIVPEILNLDERFEILTELPRIDFSASGAVLNLDDFNPEKGVVFANLKDISEPGEYEIPLEFYVPDGIKIESKSAETVFLKVSEKIAENISSESENQQETEIPEKSESAENSVSQEKSEKKAE
jgi:YbbR domain-containing protein